MCNLFYSVTRLVEELMLCSMWRAIDTSWQHCYLVRKLEKLANIWGFLKLVCKTVLLLRMGGGDVPMGRQRPLTYVCWGVFQIWWKYWHGVVAFRRDIRTIWDQGSHSDVVEDTSRVARHAVFLGKYLTVSGIAVPSSSGSWLWRRRPCDFSQH